MIQIKVVTNKNTEKAKSTLNFKSKDPPHE